MTEINKDEIAKIKSEVISELADKWQWRVWADAPRRADPAHERIANAQFVTDWLRGEALKFKKSAERKE